MLFRTDPRNGKLYAAALYTVWRHIKYADHQAASATVYRLLYLFLLQVLTACLQNILLALYIHTIRVHLFSHTHIYIHTRIYIYIIRFGMNILLLYYTKWIRKGTKQESRAPRDGLSTTPPHLYIYGKNGGIPGSNYTTRPSRVQCINELAGCPAPPAQPLSRSPSAFNYKYQSRFGPVQPWRFFTGGGMSLPDSPYIYIYIYLRPYYPPPLPL